VSYVNILKDRSRDQRLNLKPRVYKNNGQYISCIAPTCILEWNKSNCLKKEVTICGIKIHNYRILWLRLIWCISAFAFFKVVSQSEIVQNALWLMPKKGNYIYHYVHFFTPPSTKKKGGKKQHRWREREYIKVMDNVSPHMYSPSK